MSHLAGKMRGVEAHRTHGVEYYMSTHQTYTGDRKLENKPYSSSTYQVDSCVADPSRPDRTSPSTRRKNKKYSYNSSWSFNDPEVKRQKRVVKYKSYAVEGKMKSSLRNGFCWVKNKYHEIVHG